MVRIIPKTDGLYKVDQKVNIHTALYTTPAKLTIMDTHRLLGHISPESVKLLVEKGLIMGINLLESI